MSLLPSDLDLDLSELEGRSFTCDPSCGLCCLCQPEVLPHEVSWFKSNHPRRIVETKRPHRHIALTLKEGQGACTFLNASRRCEIYAQRPHYCRQFPFHLYLGKRVQVGRALILGELAGDGGLIWGKTRLLPKQKVSLVRLDGLIIRRNHYLEHLWRRKRGENVE